MKFNSLKKKAGQLAKKLGLSPLVVLGMALMGLYFYGYQQEFAELRAIAEKNSSELVQSKQRNALLEKNYQAEKARNDKQDSVIAAQEVTIEFLQECAGCDSVAVNSGSANADTTQTQKSTNLLTRLMKKTKKAGKPKVTEAKADTLQPLKPIAITFAMNVSSNGVYTFYVGPHVTTPKERTHFGIKAGAGSDFALGGFSVSRGNYSFDTEYQFWAESKALGDNTTSLRVGVLSPSLNRTLPIWSDISATFGVRGDFAMSNNRTDGTKVTTFTNPDGVTQMETNHVRVANTSATALGANVGLNYQFTPKVGIGAAMHISNISKGYNVTLSHKNGALMFGRETVDFSGKRSTNYIAYQLKF